MPNINPPTLAPPLQGIYAQISIAPVGQLAFVAGQVAIDVNGQLVGPGDYRAQAVQCFENIKAALDALDAAPSQIVRMTINVVKHRDDLVATIFAAGSDVFGNEWPICASIFLGVEALGLSAWLVEVDCIVALPVDEKTRA